MVDHSVQGYPRIIRRFISGDYTTALISPVPTAVFPRCTCVFTWGGGDNIRAIYRDSDGTFWEKQLAATETTGSAQAGTIYTYTSSMKMGVNESRSLTYNYTNITAHF